MAPAIFLILLAVALLIATYRDMRVREVPDTVSYGLITLGLLGSLIAALVLDDLAFFLEHLYGFLGGAAVGMLMFYSRQWGGGDAKLIMGVGAVLGLSWSNWQLLEFLILLIFCGAAYGIIYTLYLALIKHRKPFLKAFKGHIRTRAVHRIRIGLVITGIILLAIVLIVPLELKIIVGFILLSLYLLTYSWIFMKSVEQSIMIKEYPVSKLTEGDWIVREVKVGKRVIIGAKNTGVTNEQIAAIRRAKVKSVLVKEGIPFVPGFLLAFIVLLIINAYAGDSSIIRFFF